MKSSKTDTYYKIAAASMVLAPLFLLTGDVVWIPGGHIAEGTLLRWISYVLFLPAVAGLYYAVRDRGGKPATIGGVLCLIGIPGGVSILTLYRLGAVLKPGPSGVPEVIEASFSANPLLPATIFLPGIFFPLGLLFLGVAACRAFPRQWPAGLLLTACGPLFWVGNALDVVPVLMICDTALVVTFVWAAVQLKTIGRDSLLPLKVR